MDREDVANEELLLGGRCAGEGGVKELMDDPFFPFLGIFWRLCSQVATN